jgi:hypothetical protein
MRVLRLPVIAGLALAAVLVAVAPALSGSKSGQGKTYLFAVAVCPPYREEFPPSVCKAAVKAVVDNFSDALAIAEEDIVTLTDEKSTGTGFLAALADLGKRLTSADRLILYLNAHGDTFGLWSGHYGVSGPIGAINARIDPDDYVLVFWTKDEPRVPALALAQKDWLTVDEVADALDALPAKAAVILDSCSSGRAFSGFHLNSKDSKRIDFVLASAGFEQISNLNLARTMPLFTEQLVNALNLPMVRELGQAVAHARMTTVLQATALCSTMIIPVATFAEMFPGVPVPAEATHDQMVSPPLWLCVQVPSVADFTGEMSGTPLYRKATAK